MNRLAPTDENDEEWRLPQHAYVVVYDERETELLTIYDCGAAQKPPSAQVLGNLVRVKADHELENTVTGYVVRMREEATLRKQDDDHWIIEA
jgi:hypothetical protein